MSQMPICVFAWGWEVSAGCVHGRRSTHSYQRKKIDPVSLCCAVHGTHIEVISCWRFLLFSYFYSFAPFPALSFSRVCVCVRACVYLPHPFAHTLTHPIWPLPKPLLLWTRTQNVLKYVVMANKDDKRTNEQTTPISVSIFFAVISFLFFAFLLCSCKGIWQHSHHTFHHNYAQIFFSLLHTLFRESAITATAAQANWNFSNIFNDFGISNQIDWIIVHTTAVRKRMDEYVKRAREGRESFGESHRLMHACVYRLGQGRAA